MVVRRRHELRREAAVERDVRDQTDDSDESLRDESRDQGEDNRPRADAKNACVDEGTFQRDARGVVYFFGNVFPPASRAALGP
jgi:hypothetical protein